MKLTCIMNNGSSVYGVSCNTLTFTWNLGDAYFPATQTGYRIMISKNCEMLEQNKPDFYDSGMVQSGENVSVPYSGPELRYATRYYAKLQVRYDNSDKVLCSAPIKFITEIAPSGWQADWICKPHLEPHNDFTYFRKKAVARQTVKSAVLYVSAHNHFKLWLNQTQLSSYVAPAPSHIFKCKYYLTYDITDLIEPGENDLACILYYMNNSGQNYMNGLPGFIMQAYLEYEDGSTDIWVSDESWKTLEKTPYQAGMPCQQDRRISSVISYDFNHEAAHWFDRGYSDMHWGQAALSGINAQSWVLKPQFIPESVVNEKIIPVALLCQTPGNQVFDVGKIISGWVEIRLMGIKDAAVTIRYSEDLDLQGHVKHNVANETSDYYYDTCVLSDEKDLIFTADFTYKAFRYFEITGYPALVDVRDIRAVSTGTNLSYHSSFKCSDSVLNQVYKACIQTQKNNALNQLVDCPHREQSQYVTDSDFQAETMLYNFNAYPLLKKVLDDFKYAQFNDGRLPFVFPTNFESEDFRLNIPEWDLYYSSILWKVYSFYRDKDLLRQYYSTMQKIIRHFLQLSDPQTGLVARGTGWHISDWPYSQVDDQQAAYLTVENCLLYFNLNTAAKIAEVLEKPQESESYRTLAKQLRENVCKYLYSKEKKLFLDSFPSRKTSQAVNTACFYYGLVPDEDANALLANIVAMPFECSVLMTNKLLRTLFTHHQEEVAYHILSRRTQPGWGYMMSLGFQTVWEGFSNIESHCHAWNAYPARMMQEFLCGIQSDDPGFRRIRIHPYVPVDLTYAWAEVETPAGRIFSGWEKKDSTVTFTIRIPVNATAVFDLPDGFLLGGQPNVALTSGSHQFTI